MFISKKKKIQAYLNNNSDCMRSTFDLLLRDYLDGTLKKDLETVGLTKIEIHIDCFDDIKCIGIQGKYKKYYMDLQISPNEFSVSFDLIEPDEGKAYPLADKNQVYTVLSNTIQALDIGT